MANGEYEEILKAYAPRRENLVTAFQDIQEKEGYISEGALAAASAEKTAVGVGDASTRLILIKPDRFLLYFDKKRNKHSDVILGVCVGGFSRREDILLPVSVLGG